METIFETIREALTKCKSRIEDQMMEHSINKEEYLKRKNLIDTIEVILNELSKNWRIEDVSDGYHTIKELYDHRYALLIALCNVVKHPSCWIKLYKTKQHVDWTMFIWYFLVQWTIHWNQISYHLPLQYRDIIEIPEIDKAYPRDWHTSDDVVKRLLSI